MLMALHACDTATDDAIAYGIKNKASYIICSPCCHKQIRKEIRDADKWHPILQHGILKERQAEIITDSIRALIMEAHGYKTKIFEFISTEHTSKNLMLIGKKRSSIFDAHSKKCLAEVQDMKSEFGINSHYLETLLSE